jgi:hypothetical protein
VLTVTAAWGGTGGGDRAGGKAAIEIPDDYWYFGYVPQNTIVIHDYWVYNRGSAPLQIAKVKPGCACTGTQVDKDMVPPGDSARLRARFDTQNLRGRVVKNIDVMSDDPDNPLTTVRFFAIVASQHADVKIYPETAGFPNTSGKDYHRTCTLEITNDSESEIELSVIESSSPSLVPRLARTSLKPGAKSKLDIAMEAPPEKPGLFNASVTIEFSGEQKDRITIPIAGFYRP